MSAKTDMSVLNRSDAPAPGGKAFPLRQIAFGDPDVSIERRADGTIYLRPKRELGEYPDRLTDRLLHWADAAPDRIFMAERDPGGGWRQISFVPASIEAFSAREPFDLVIGRYILIHQSDPVTLLRRVFCRGRAAVSPFVLRETSRG